jgi:endothelin-converting enzyme/putative endopeptidase
MQGAGVAGTKAYLPCIMPEHRFEFGTCLHEITLRGTMRSVKICVFLILTALVTLAQTGKQTTPPKPKEPPTKDARFSPDMLDKDSDPCTDFYAYACRKWQAQNPVPGDQPEWGRFDELREHTEQIMRGILEKYAVNSPKRDEVEQKIGDYYQSCMDEKAIEKAGTGPIGSTLESIAILGSGQNLANLAAYLQRLGIGAFFNFDSTQDFQDATQVIAEVDQGGMALPDRDYYVKDDPKSVELRKQYAKHVQTMFELLGDAPEKASAEAKTVLDIETSLAKSALDVTSRRDPNKVYHKMTLQQLAELSPEFEWNLYRRALGAPRIESLNVTEPEFFKHLNEVLKTTPVEDLKTYLRWHVVHAAAPLLPARFVNENFDFFDKVLEGTKELSPRWKRCVRYTNGDLGEAVGQKYVALTFGEESKERMLKMVQALETALSTDMDSLSWMGPETKKQAQEKLAAITNRIGHPNKWRDYSAVAIIRGDALGNSWRANEFEFHRQLAKIGKPVDKNDWPYPPTTVNASYNAQLNNITFPAAVLQSPFFDNKADDAMNYGAIGSFIGHELSHGFDDQGSQFDAQGNLRNWWTEADKKAFDERTKCVADQYSGYTAVPGLKLNGKLTLGENVADNGGVRIAYMALLSTIAGKEPAPVDGLTTQQRFFLGWANAWCQNETEEFRRMLTTIDPHSPSQWRVNGTLSNMPEFREAFHCKTDAPMVRENSCRVW